MIKNMCCNFAHNKCLGATWKPQEDDPEYKHFVFNKTDDCIIKKGKRCIHFENTILPVIKKENNKRALKQYLSKLDIPDREKDVIIGTLTDNTCNQCGTPIGSRKKYCYKCSNIRRKKSKNTYQKQYMRETRKEPSAC